MPHPNIHVFLNILLEVQSNIYIKIISTGTQKARKQNYIRNEIRKYDEGEKSRFDFVRSVSHYLKI